MDTEPIKFTPPFDDASDWLWARDAVRLMLLRVLMATSEQFKAMAREVRP